MQKCTKCPSMVSVVHWKVAVGFVAQRIERLSPEQKVEGSNPFEPTRINLCVSQAPRGSLSDDCSFPDVMHQVTCQIKSVRDMCGESLSF